MLSARSRVWLWQLSYAVLGLCFLVGLFVAVASWSTGAFKWWLGGCVGSVLLLALLDRVLHPRPRPDTCPGCGYSTTGLPAEGPCPECGAGPTPIADDRHDARPVR